MPAPGKEDDRGDPELQSGFAKLTLQDSRNRSQIHLKELFSEPFFSRSEEEEAELQPCLPGKKEAAAS